MKKVLVFVNSFRVGGVTSVVKSIYENLDRTRFKMDFVSFGPLDEKYVEEINKNGDKVYFVTPIGLNKIPVFNYVIRRYKIIKQICKVVKKGEYDAAHIHANAYACLLAAKKLGISVRIMHAHEAVSDFNGNEEKSYIINLIWKYRVKMYNKLATVKAGTSMKACRAKFGDAVVDDSAVKVIYPYIDINKFDSSLYNRTDVIEKYRIDTNSFNMIHIGRLLPVKNQTFTLGILKEMNKIKDTYLYIVGSGKLELDLLNKAKELGIEDKFTILPPDTTAGIYTAMDCFLLPSLSEAFGMVAVESQMMGVPCFASTNVPIDVDCGMCTFIDLKEGVSGWVSQIAGYDYENLFPNRIKMEQFHISNIIKEVESLYDI